MGYTVALVTGGASGLGESATRSLSKYGYKVAILDLNVERAEAIVNELGASNTFFVKTDVSNETQVKEAIQKVVATFGAIHLVLNSAGILAAAKIFTNRGVASTDVLQKVLTVNVAGTFNVTKYAAQQIASQQPVTEDGSRGCIINVASVAGIEGQDGQSIYSASKGAIIGMTVPLARDLGRYNIRVITIAPGVFKTPMAHALSESVEKAISSQVPLGRLGIPAEFGETVYHLASCTYLNAEIIRLDGGVRLPKL